MSDYLFISDLHISIERPEIIDLFLKFMDQVAPSTRSLYILGDFLEYWIGDDMVERIQGTPLADVFSSLEVLHDKGTEVFVMHGNRDFLIGDALAKRYHFNLIEDPCTIEINGIPVLLMHGDTLCTDDVEYQQFRSMVRDKSWQETFLSRSLEEREQIAKDLRKQSREAVTGKKPDIMDVNQQVVFDTMKQHRVAILIHGHTHRPAIHDYQHEGKNMKRYVLADWYDSGSYLEISDGKYSAHKFS